MNHSRRKFIGGSLAAAGLIATRSAPALARRATKRRKPLFEDGFGRRDRRGWGRAWFNQRYKRYWAIDSRRGIFRLPPTENRFEYRPDPVLVLDHDVANLDLRVTVSASNATGRVGVAARATAYGDYYVVYLGPRNRLRISRCTHHKERRLASVNAPFEANRRYRMRIKVRGGDAVTIKAKVWPVGAREPRRWNAEARDSTAAAIGTPGAFGMFFEHATDRRGSSFRVTDFVARSSERGGTTRPEFAYSFAGPPSGSKTRLVAKTCVPARISFEVAADPAFGEVLQVLGPKRTSRAQTAKVTADTSVFPPANVVYWRPIAQRGRVKVVGPTHSFRTAPPAGLPVRFAFGSCTRWQVSPRRSFDHARLKLPDLYIHHGDFGYAATKVASHAADTYQDHWTRMLMDPSFAQMTRTVPFTWLRDDSDYGTNDADRRTIRRFTIGAHDQLNANPGSYFETRYGDVAIFSIDCRRFSTGRKGVDPQRRSKLGAEQKRWLKSAMTKAVKEGAGLLVVSSPQAFGSDSRPTGWRKNYGTEWSELIDFFQSLQAAVLIIAGDNHGHRLHEYPQKNLQPDVPRIVEIVSSGTEQNKFFPAVDPRIIIKHAKGSGFGVVEVGPEETVAGQKTRTLTLTAVRTKDGTPFWTANYLVVRGVGLLPTGL